MLEGVGRDIREVRNGEREEPGGMMGVAETAWG